MRGLGLRPRMVATFALVVAVASAALATTSYVIVRGAVLSRARDAAVQAAQNRLAEVAAAVPPGASAADVLATLQGLPSIGAETIVLAADGSFEPTSVSLDPASIPPSLRAAVDRDRVASVRTGSGRRDHIVVGGRIPDGPSLYLFFPLADEIADLEVLRNVLAGTGAALVLVSALVGVVATRSLLRPLRRARLAAHRLEVGLLATRLPEEGHDEFTDLARAFNRMADALQRTVADLRTLEASHRRFVSDVSHELRTPLTALNTAADVLESNTDGINDVGRRAARLLVVESRRLAAMVEDLMEISRMDAGAAAMVWEPIDVGTLVGQALEARAWTDRVDVEVGPNVTTHADPRRLDAVVANLVGNALEHGGPPVRVSVTASESQVTITVSDHGQGIPPDHLDSIFERFYKADPSRSRGGGSGLGLAIARENARMHGGDVTVASRPGRGTTFTCTLPRRPSAPDANEPVVPPVGVAERLPSGDDPVTTATHHVLIDSKRRRGEG